jgi:hypothetical protein
MRSRRRATHPAHRRPQLDLTDDERAALEGDRDALTALTQRLRDTPTPAGPTPKELGMNAAFIPLTTLTDSLTTSRPPTRTSDA